MKYGPHSADVQDLVDFVKSGQLLRNPRQPRDPKLRIIHNLNNAESYRDVPDDAPDDAPDDSWVWRDILDYAGMCGSYLPSERLNRLKIITIENLNKLYDEEVWTSLNQQLAGRYSEDVVSNIWSDLSFIIGYRATFGRTLPFIEQLIELYRLGGYPCGWDGLHPEGRLVVYFPPEDGFKSIQYK